MHHYHSTPTFDDSAYLDHRGAISPTQSLHGIYYFYFAPIAGVPICRHQKMNRFYLNNDGTSTGNSYNSLAHPYGYNSTSLYGGVPVTIGGADIPCCCSGDTCATNNTPCTTCASGGCNCSTIHGPSFPINSWIKVEFLLRKNNTCSVAPHFFATCGEVAGECVGCTDVMKVWINGTLTIDRSNMNLGEGTSAPYRNFWLMGNASNDNGNGVPCEETIYMDDICVDNGGCECGGQACGATDTTSPGPVTDLCVGTPAAGCTQTGVTSTSAPLKWTSAGDDGATGTPAIYLLRAKVTTPPTDCLPFVEADWAGATILTPPAVAAGGSVVSTTVTGLTPNRNYCFAVKTRDEVPNESQISISTATNKATTPPSGGGVCGNGQVETGEACDGAALNGETCKTRGFPGGGTLLCKSGCTQFDTTSCSGFTSAAAIPVIWFLDVPSAPVGSPLAIQGKNFGTVTGTVTVGGTSATVTSWSATRVVITVPSKTTGASYPVVLTPSGGTPVTSPENLQVHVGTIRSITGGGAADTGNCSVTPCATIGYALTQAVAGDVLLIYSGTYNETTGAGAAIIISTLNTSASAPLTLRGAPGSPVLLGCSGCYTCTSGCTGCTSGDVVKVNAPYVYLTNLRITGSREDGIQFHGNFDRITNSRIYGANTAACPDLGGGSGLTFESTSTGVEVLGNEIDANGSNPGADNGIFMRGTNGTIAWNTIHGNAFGDGIIMLGAGTGSKVYSNVIYSNAYHGIEIIGTHTNAQLGSNIIYSNTRSGLRIDSGGGNFQIQNNTFWANGGSTYYGLDLVRSGATSSSIRGNIVAGPDNTLLVSKGTSTLTFTGSFASNLYNTFSVPGFAVAGVSKTFSAWTTASGESSAIYASPSFVSASTADYHLQVMSLAINRSASPLCFTFGTGSRCLDFEGRSRPFDVGSEMGASEYQPGTGAAIGGGTITGLRFSTAPTQ